MIYANEMLTSFGKENGTDGREREFSFRPHEKNLFFIYYLFVLCSLCLLSSHPKHEAPVVPSNVRCFCLFPPRTYYSLVFLFVSKARRHRAGIIIFVSSLSVRGKRRRERKRVFVSTVGSLWKVLNWTPYDGYRFEPKCPEISRVSMNKRLIKGSFRLFNLWCSRFLSGMISVCLYIY